MQDADVFYLLVDMIKNLVCGCSAFNESSCLMVFHYLICVYFQSFERNFGKGFVRTIQKRYSSIISWVLFTTLFV